MCCFASADPTGIWESKCVDDVDQKLLSEFLFLSVILQLLVWGLVCFFLMHEHGDAISEEKASLWLVAGGQEMLGEIL